MADQPTNPPQPDTFTGRMYYAEYTLQMVIPVPLGGSPTTDPVDIQRHFGAVIHSILKQLPFVSTFKFQPAGTPRSVEVFESSPRALQDRMKTYIEECESANEQQSAIRGKLIVTPGSGQTN